jgi:hypothetical protein
MADVVRERIAANRKAEISGNQLFIFQFVCEVKIYFVNYVGVVINTCGWVRGEGYNQIKHIAQAFEVNTQILSTTQCFGPYPNPKSSKFF